MYPIQQLNVALLNNISMAASATSIVQDVSSCVRLSIQASWNGTSPVGTLYVYGSNDGINFNEDPEITPIAISGNTGSAFAKIANCSYPWLQIVYVFASGTGTLNVTVSGKNK